MRKRNRRKISRLPEAIIAAGIILVLVPVFLSLRMSVLQSREAAAVKPLPPVPVAAQPIPEPPKPAPDKPLTVASDQKPSIVIPKLNLDAVIVEEVTEADLDRGPMRLAGTGVPGQGNCCIAGHKEKWFKGLKKLVVGDAIILRSGGMNYVYTVTSRKIVAADNVSVLRETSIPTVTLITCINPSFLRRGDGRLVVKAEMKTVN